MRAYRDAICPFTLPSVSDPLMGVWGP